MIILDTNVLSALMQQTPDPRVLTWLDRQPRSSIWTTSITLLEIRYGVQVMAIGKRRSLLVQAFETVLQKMAGRIAAFDAATASQAADLMTDRRRRGQPGDLRDTLIAGIVLAHRASLATRNTSHFADLSVSVINPWIA